MAAVAHAPSPNLQPRSILKRPCHQSEPDLVNLPATLALSLSVTPPTPPRRCPNSVRFPPSPTLTRTFSAHSATAYDRSPIVVLPNSCALPARGCPGRTYHPSSCQAKQISSSRSPSPTRNSPKHSPATSAPPMPPLIVDVSSESDESDAVGSPPPPPAALFGTPTIYTPPEPLPALSLSFLPYPSALFRAPLSEPDERQYQSYEDEKEKDKQRRRREREHKAHRADGSGRRGGARARERTAASRATDGALEEEDDAEEDDQEGSSGGQYKSFGERSALTGCGFDDADEGCLGGF